MDMKKITEKFQKMPEEEFNKLLAQHADSEWAVAFRELDEFSKFLQQKT